MAKSLLEERFQRTVQYFLDLTITRDYSYGCRGNTMRQRRICEYLGLSCTHRRNFFCIPPAIRYQIYVEAGLVDDSDLAFNGYDNDAVCLRAEELKNCRNLLLTCRTVYAEVSLYLYSSNRFLIHYKGSKGLQILRNLRPSSLASLTDLTLHLNVTSCPPGGVCFKAHSGGGQICRGQNTPLRASSHECRALLSDWQTTFKYMTAHLTASQLRFHLVCDVEDLETAHQVVKPLTSTRLLADCAIRLARQPDSRIQRLARETAMRATGNFQKQSASSFRYLDLPPELRQKILEYTNLVTPLREVEWNPKNGFYLRYSTWRCGGEWECPPELHHACRFRNCWEWSNRGCFCCRYHAAFSSKCHCWSPPTDLFLVCQAMRAHAQAIFFASNRFIITPSTGCHSPPEGAPARLEVSEFLLNIVPRTALYFINFLEVVIPPFDEYYLHSDGPAYQEWLQTIEYVKEKFNLPLLTLRIYMAEYNSSGCGSRPFHADMAQEQRVMLVKTYARIVAPLSKLQGLRRCFVHIAWPFDWSAAGRRVRYRDVEAQTRGVEALEHKLERCVLGSNYDSTTLGKSKLRRSQWLEVSMSASEYV